MAGRLQKAVGFYIAVVAVLAFSLLALSGPVTAHPQAGGGSHHPTFEPPKFTPIQRDPMSATLPASGVERPSFPSAPSWNVWNARQAFLSAEACLWTPTGYYSPFATSVFGPQAAFEYASPYSNFQGTLTGADLMSWSYYNNEVASDLWSSNSDFANMNPWCSGFGPGFQSWLP